MDIKERISEKLKIFDELLSDEVIENASKEELLRYIELSEKIKARLEML